MQKWRRNKSENIEWCGGQKADNKSEVPWGGEDLEGKGKNVVIV